jgi:AhpD family alkylhydroperoxidase
MKKLNFALFILLSLFQFQHSSQASTKPEVENIYQDIRKELGILPSFLKEYPPFSIAGAWIDLKGLLLNPQTILPPKYKELIALAVSNQIPCRYGQIFHSEFARFYKAGDLEMKEAIAVAGLTRKWSVFFHGIQLDPGEYRSEIDKALMYQNNLKNFQAMEIAPTNEERKIETAEEVYRDAKKIFGFVPNFLTQYPKASVVGAWREFKGLSFNSYTTIPLKYKSLLGLAVASQIPCSYCVYFHTLSAILEGATKEEIQESAAIAAQVRNWSGNFNGLMMSDADFKNEVAQMIDYLKNKPTKVTVTPNLSTGAATK